MSLTTPFGEAKKPFDIDNTYYHIPYDLYKTSFTFTTSKYDVFNSVTIKIYNSNMSKLFERNISTGVMYVDITIKDLYDSGVRNSKEPYYYTITTHNSSESSYESKPVGFYVLTDTVLEFQNLDKQSENIIDNFNYPFTVKYFQKEGDLIDEIKFTLYEYASYKYQIVNEKTFYNKDLNNGNIFVDGDIVCVFNKQYSEDIYVSSLKPNTEYKVKAECKTLFGNTISTNDIIIKTTEVENKFYANFDVQNDSCNGRIKIECGLQSIYGKTNKTPIYIDGTKIDLSLDSLNYSNNINISNTDNNGFILKTRLNPSNLGRFNQDRNYNSKICEFSTDSASVRDLYYNIPSIKRCATKYLLYWSTTQVNGEYKDVLVWEKRAIIKPLSSESELASILCWKSMVVFNSEINNLSDIYVELKSHCSGNADIPIVAFVNPNSIQDNSIIWNGESNVEYNKSTNIFYNNGVILGSNVIKEYISDDLPITYNHHTFSWSGSDNRILGNTINNITFTNAVYDYVDITNYKNTYLLPSSVDWEMLECPSWIDGITILNCDFDNNINGGRTNIDFEMASVLVKRRLWGSLDWVVLHNVEINTKGDFQFTKFDYTIPTNQVYEYGIFITQRVADVSGNLITVENPAISIVKEVASYFEGLFICDANKSFKLYSDVVYGSHTDNISVATYPTIGRKYPTVVQNGNINYFSGSVSGNVLGYNYEKNRVIDRYEINRQLDDLSKFLTDGNSKIIKDHNGKVWLSHISNSPTQSSNSSYGNAIKNISFDFVEVGSIYNQDDLYNSNFCDVM